MCVFLSLRMNKAQIKKQYDVTDVAGEFFGPIFVQSAFDHPLWPVMTGDKPGELQLFSWGLIPSWVKDEQAAMKIRTSTVNARIETVQEKPSFRSAVRKSRCLIPADGFYEFRELNKKKYPYFITLKGEEPFFMAGLYESWTNRETGEVVQTFSILTTEANELMGKIHNRKLRMPVILASGMAGQWLDLSRIPDDFSVPFPSAGMQAWTVSRRLVSRSEERNAPESVVPHLYPEVQMADQLNI